MIRSRSGGSPRSGSFSGGRTASALCRGRDGGAGDRVDRVRPGPLAARRGGDGQVEALAEPFAPGGLLRWVLPAGLGDHLDRADLEPFEGLLGMVGAEQHGQGVLAHQLAEERQPVHPGHVHVEQDGRRDRPLHDLDGLVRVRRQQDAEAPLGLDDRLQGLPRDGAVVHDQDGQGRAIRHGASTLRKIEAAIFCSTPGRSGRISQLPTTSQPPGRNRSARRSSSTRRSASPK